MEISHYLHNAKTMELREKFLESVFFKHESIVTCINDLHEDLSSDKKIELLSYIFNEAHKLKGSGGTYGFYEITRVYFNLLIYIRSAKNDIRALTKAEFKSASLIANEFTKYYPVLRSAFSDIKNQIQNMDASSIFCVAKNRDGFFPELEEISLSKNLMLFSVMTMEDAFFALDKISSSKVFIYIEYHEDEFLPLIKQIKCKEYVSTIIVISDELSRTEDYLDAGATKVLSSENIDWLQIFHF